MNIIKRLKRNLSNISLGPSQNQGNRGGLIKEPSDRILKNGKIEEIIKADKNSDITKSKNPFKVGDILCCEWGYSMDLVNFYKVISTTNSFIEIVSLENKTVSSDEYLQEGKVIPSNKEVESKDVDGKKFKVKFRNNNPYISINSSITPVEKWDGKPKYFNLYD